MLASLWTGEYNISQMIRAYILIKLVPGLEPDALSRIRLTQGVVDVNLVFGQWDAIAIAEAESLFALAKTVVQEVRSIQGIQDTTTLVQGVI